jgi:hypothetical protein
MTKTTSKCLNDRKDWANVLSFRAKTLDSTGKKSGTLPHHCEATRQEAA